MGLFDNSVSKISMKILALAAALTMPTPAMAQGSGCLSTAP